MNVIMVQMDEVLKLLMQVKSGLDSPLRLSCQPCHHVWDAVVHMETFDRQGLIGDLVPFRPLIKYCCQGLKSNSCRVWEISNTGAFEPASKEKSGRLGKGTFKVFELLRSVFEGATLVCWMWQRYSEICD